LLIAQEMCSALSSSVRRKKLDASIQNGFRWLLRMITRSWEELDERVKTDVQDKVEAEKREKAERVRRVQRSRELRCTVNHSVDTSSSAMTERPRELGDFKGVSHFGAKF